VEKFYKKLPLVKWYDPNLKSANEVKAFELSEYLGLHKVPPTISVPAEGDNYVVRQQFAEKTRPLAGRASRDDYAPRESAVFDGMIGNIDRFRDGLGPGSGRAVNNILVNQNGEVTLIDHEDAFRDDGYKEFNDGYQVTDDDIYASFERREVLDKFLDTDWDKYADDNLSVLSEAERNAFVERTSKLQEHTRRLINEIGGRDEFMAKAQEVRTEARLKMAIQYKFAAPDSASSAYGDEPPGATGGCE